MSPLPTISPVILCGGSGTRLWPLSRQSFPKQFVPIVGGKSLLELTLDRLQWCGSSAICVAAEDHRFLVQEALVQAGVPGQILLEPVARNTAAAITLAALLSRDRSDEDGMLLFCPADHHIPDVSRFESTIRSGLAAAAAGAIVTFGVTPTFPSSAYGYIEQGAAREDGAVSVERFIEKPSATAAEQLLLSGNVLWNAGIFLARTSCLLTAVGRYAPDILQVCEAAMAQSNEELIRTEQMSVQFVRPNANTFTTCRSQSFDYAVMEHHDNVAVVPFSGQWSDVGGWNAVAELTSPDASENRIKGSGHVLNAKNTYIHATSRTVVALGTSDLLIVETPDAVLIADKNCSEQVKDVVALLSQRKQPEALMHRRVARPWGWYDSIDHGERFQVKRIGVKPGASLSLQKHHHRAEHWIVVKGTAEVTRGTERFLLSENQSTYIPIGEVHRLHNPGKLELEMIEVQSGSYLGEDDIVRLEDHYGRLPGNKAS